MRSIGSLAAPFTLDQPLNTQFSAEPQSSTFFFLHYTNTTPDYDYRVMLCFFKSIMLTQVGTVNINLLAHIMNSLCRIGKHQFSAPLSVLIFSQLNLIFPPLSSVKRWDRTLAGWTVNMYSIQHFIVFLQSLG